MLLVVSQTRDDLSLKINYKTTQHHLLFFYKVFYIIKWVPKEQI